MLLLFILIHISIHFFFVCLLKWVMLKWVSLIKNQTHFYKKQKQTKNKNKQKQTKTNKHTKYYYYFLQWNIYSYFYFYRKTDNTNIGWYRIPTKMRSATMYNRWMLYCSIIAVPYCCRRPNFLPIWICKFLYIYVFCVYYWQFFLL